MNSLLENYILVKDVLEDTLNDAYALIQNQLNGCSLEEFILKYRKDTGLSLLEVQIICRKVIHILLAFKTAKTLHRNLTTKCLMIHYTKLDDELKLDEIEDVVIKKN